MIMCKIDDYIKETTDKYDFLKSAGLSNLKGEQIIEQLTQSFL